MIIIFKNYFLYSAPIFNQIKYKQKIEINVVVEGINVNEGDECGLRTWVWTKKISTRA